MNLTSIASTKTRRLLVVVALLGLMAALPVVSPAPAHGAAQQCPTFGSKKTTGKIGTSTIREASGLVASRANAPVLWTHNDSGGRNEIFAVGANGALKMTARFGSVNVRDFEDISIGPGPGGGDYIYAADIGDNGNDRDYVRLYRFPEPEVSSGSITIPDSQVEEFRFTYQRPSGGTWSRNAEALAVDPVTGDVVIIEKRHQTRDGTSHTSLVYRLRQSDLVEGRVLVAKAMTWAKTRYERDIGPPAGADFSKDGRMLVVKNGYEVFAWLRRPGQSIYNAIKENPATNCLYLGAVGEAVAVGVGGGGLFFVREGRNPPIERTRISIPSPPAKCAGLKATLVGTPGADVLEGTSGPDVIVGLGGADVINGLGGNDVICGARGHDVIDGGPGDDVVYGAAGDDEVLGSAGADRIYGGGGNDLLQGGDTGDSLYGGPGNDALDGGGGFDKLFGGTGADSCDVGPGGGKETDC